MPPPVHFAGYLHVTSRGNICLTASLSGLYLQPDGSPISNDYTFSPGHYVPDLDLCTQNTLTPKAYRRIQLIRQVPRGLSIRAHKDEQYKVCNAEIKIYQPPTLFRDSESYPPPKALLVRSDSSDSLHCARKIHGEQVDLSLVKKWISVCEKGHKGCLSLGDFGHIGRDQLSKNVHGLKVIDVLQRMVVTAPPDCRYAALSYVWGKSPVQFQTMKANLAIVSSFLGLDALGVHIPQTITDAMTLVYGIGERYLWVDTLCIVQDDLESKSYWIAEMASVYRRALVSILAASGEDANAGLPGIRPGSRKKRDQIMEEVKPGVQLTVTEGPTTGWDLTEGTVYRFQERLLSRRNIIFGKDKTSFECSQTRFEEEIIYEHEDFTYQDHEAFGLNQSIPLMRLNASVFIDQTYSFSHPLHNNYIQIMCEYSRKILTHEGDILNAFAGISRVLSADMESPFLYGHPVRFFDLSLLWQWSFSQQVLERRHGFPSWSWSGWLGEKDWSKSRIGNEEIWQKEYSFIVWKVSESRDEIANGSMLSSAIRRPGRSPDEVLGGTRNFGLTQILPYQAGSGTELFRRLYLHTNYFTISAPSIRLDIWGLVSSKAPTTDLFDPGKHELHIHGKAGEHCGRLFHGCANHAMMAEMALGKKVLCDFIVLSVGECDKDCIRHYPREEKDCLALNVIAVDWKEGIAERIGIGIIFLHTLEEDCLEPGP
ncbi:hypothetical protein HYALB_00003502 [Hymenoscyphus albidus]|uniref:Heterokaryon incompatibility domain-containing protein n=1 Tax=Hymenoscyphus albidus TaxID=595503 RepID=A0A9N9Q7M4_9HELO|nr:hypothetical protein HYALB_00003502 [Hymenoscyphus albidus]